MTSLIDLVEQTVCDKDGSNERVLRFANKLLNGTGMTRRSDTPASTPYTACLTNPGTMSRSAWSPDATTGKSTVGYGACVFDGTDGLLDSLRSVVVHGKPHVRRRGPWDGVYPDDFPVVFRGVASRPSVTLGTTTLGVLDQQAVLEVPLQKVKYAGDNVLPDGVEGVADLKDKPKALAFGALSQANITPVPVNTARLVLQASANALASVDSVRDRGVPLGTGRIWELQDSDCGSTFVLRAIWDGDQWMIGCVDGSISTSPDGRSFTRQTVLSFFVQGLAFDGTTHTAVGASSGVNYAATSTDGGVTWATVIVAGLAGQFSCLHFDATFGLLYAGTLSGEICSSSDAGVTWTIASTIMAPYSTIAITSGMGLVVFVGASGVIVTTSDATTFVARTVAFQSALQGLYAVACLDGVGFFAAGSGGENGAAYSFDGLTWIRVPNPLGPGNNANAMIADPATQTFVLVGTAGSRASSVDMIEWHTQPATVFGASTIYAIATDGSGAMLAGGQDGKVAFAVARVYADEAEMMDDANRPLAGQYIACPSIGMFRLGAPAEEVTCGITEGATSADRTHAQVFVRILQYAGYTSGAWSAADIVALDLLASAEAQLYLPDEITVAAALDLIASSVGAFWGADRQGVFRIRRLDPPSDMPVLRIVEKDLRREIAPKDLADNGSQGVPRYSSIVRYARNYTVQTSSLAGAVTPANRARYGQEWLKATTTDPSVLAIYPLALQPSEPTCFVHQADADAESARRQSLRGVVREAYDLVLEWNSDTSAALLSVELGDVITLEHSRFGLTGSADLVVLGIIDNARDDASAGISTITFTGWGRAA